MPKTTEKPRKPPVVFLGPTMDQWHAAKCAAADFRPPAAMGDVTQAAVSDTSCIVIIDGVFESSPAVWHKEILYALSLDIPVIGASSMGALRAAELHTLGMHGFGVVFQDFASGLLTDDDEVAVSHGPAETGWIQLSDAMVDIRASVDRAIKEGVISNTEGTSLLRHAKAEHFKKRSIQASLSEVSPRFHSAEVFSSVSKWFAEEFVNQKRTDCHLLLQRLPEILRDAQNSLRLAKRFVSTSYLKQLEPFGYVPERDHRL